MNSNAPVNVPRARTPPAQKVLLVDDDATQLKLGRLRLCDAGFEVETASGAEEALRKAKQQTPDAILSDVLMGDVDGFGLCRLVREEPSLAGVPVILLSAHYQGEPDQQFATCVGASALVSRTPEFDAELEALQRSLIDRHPSGVDSSDGAVYEQHLRTNANQLAKLLGQAKQAEERYRTLFENAYDGITVLTADGVILDANERWREVLGVPPDQMIGRHIRQYAAPGHEKLNVEGYQRSIANGAGRPDAMSIRRPDGRLIWMEFSNTIVEIDGKSLVFAIGRDVTTDVEAARSLAAAEAKYRSLVERIPDVIWTATVDGTVTFVTQNVQKLLGFSVQDICAEDLETRSLRIHPDDRSAVTTAFRAYSERGKPFDTEYRRQSKDGRWVWVRNRATAIYDRDGVRYIDGMLSDVTERRQLEEGLKQAQKMEAIGQLTGGIAHDFNNILAAILANSHFLIEELAEQDPRRTDAQEIKAAAERAAALTRQLLAFSRRQLLEPSVVDLNATVAGLEKMLRRLIGEDIEFTVAASADLGSVKVDVSQIEQVIMNLVVNARDAMPTGGRLSIETANVELDEYYGASHLHVVPGKYVMLAISDTGSGMDAETLRRVFEPFFTTKELGKGTGLGLSTCYGIVKQSGGYIWAYSEPGQGAVFKVYLPRVEELPTQARRQTGGFELNGTETILVVEDDPGVRNAVSRMLKPRGYRLLTARNGLEAIELAERHNGAIDLVLSDVVMPDTSGPDVVRQVQARFAPTARALFMSGYTDHAILQSGALQPGTNFIQKPFAPETLLRKIREVLGG